MTFSNYRVFCFFSSSQLNQPKMFAHKSFQAFTGLWGVWCTCIFVFVRTWLGKLISSVSSLQIYCGHFAFHLSNRFLWKQNFLSLYFCAFFYFNIATYWAVFYVFWCKYQCYICFTFISFSFYSTLGFFFLYFIQYHAIKSNFPLSDMHISS